MAPDVSTATGWKMKRPPNSAYLAILIIIIMVIFKRYFSGEHIALSINKNNMTSAASATDPAASAARILFEDANVLTHVVSQMR